MKIEAGLCEMCGNHVDIRQKAHIVAEGSNERENLLMLCPSCHVRFDTALKPKLRTALQQAGVEELPKSWATSIYAQARAASAASRQQTSRPEATRRTWGDPEIRARRVAGIRRARARKLEDL